ncbi:secretion activator protein [Pseudoalteromonas sp. JBTF-M23]|uniref:Secretion activator protein n=1 Tax=Pseudoalteromonas caenipelagi TaxID=2726988 RepID=A0A849VJV3_9GAMM|nr:glycosyl hydrolase 108 family protein [Pseudoalteromonas caenipelagi]NOU53120.1 secretion activator protein [Pseudoalteromonas caenipelagi]
MLTQQQLDHYRQIPEIAAALAGYSDAFCRSVLTILYLEGGLRDDGGLNNVASDRGGLTKYGISQRAYPKTDIANLKIGTAIRYYYRDYWEPMHCDELNSGVALMLFDGAVQHGINSMTRIVQRTTGAGVDGLFGARTLKQCLAILPNLFICELISRRGYRYARICLDDPKQLPNLKGWMNRLGHITERCYAEVYRGA